MNYEPGNSWNNHRTPLLPANAAIGPCFETLMSHSPTITQSNPTYAAKPNRTVFDAWNSSATGHQRAENRLSGSTSWRHSRSRKLGEQFGDTQLTGGARLADTVGAGSEDFGQDGRTENRGWMRGAKGLRDQRQKSLWELNDMRSGKAGAEPGDHKMKEKGDHGAGHLAPSNEPGEPLSGEMPWLERSTDALQSEKNIFRNLNFYINGSTYPLISDHKLKHLLVSHGGSLSIALGRRTVTHVILGELSSPNGSGAGGGIAAGKIEKEIATCRGKGVKFVRAAWALESIKAGKRLPEAGFVKLKLAPKGQRSVRRMLEKTTGKL